MGEKKVPPATSETLPNAARGSSMLLDSLSWLTLALATLVTTWPLGLTNRVLAGVDSFTYFLPYWGYRMAEMRAGHLPLWNPYLFMGVPFLANMQAAVLYPLHWPLTWLPPERALIWSALLHVWLGACLTFTFGRRSLGLGRGAAWLAGIVFGLGGVTLGRLENINQLNALAWLPALLWLLDETARASDWRHRIRWGVGLAIAIAVQLLAGHAQTAFINLAGLAVYATTQAGRTRWRYQRTLAPASDRTALPRQRALQPPTPTIQPPAPSRFLLPLVALVPGLMLCGAQLLPSIELSSLSIRSGGLSYQQAVSFSLRPRLLAQTFLPAYGGGLAEAFATEGYAEYAGWTSLAALALAAVAVRRLWPRRALAGPRPPMLGLLVLTCVGALLALGAYNPISYLLWRFVPGFDLFRAPARWLALFTLGIAGLAGIGLERISSPGEEGSTRFLEITRALVRSARGLSPPKSALATAVAVLLIGLIAFQQWPCWQTVLGWAVAAGTVAALLFWRQRFPRAIRWGLIGLAFADLWLGARSLPFSQATAPMAMDLRNAPAALLGATSGQPPPGRDRFLSMSDIRFDPGDLQEIRALQADRLPQPALDRLVRAAKQTEVIAPNLSMRYGLPAVDGYDGGMLPLKTYVELLKLFLPADQILPDGRLREQLRQIPADRLLDLTGVRYVITDKQNDLWIDDVYYDLEGEVLLQPGDTLTLDLRGYPRFSATALGVVSHLAGEQAGDGDLVAAITLERADGVKLQLAMGTPADTTSAQAQQQGAQARIARQWGQDHLAVLAFAHSMECHRDPCASVLRRIDIKVLPHAGAPLVIRGLSLIDQRTGAHQSISLSPRGDRRRIHSGDVKVYERTFAPGRAWLVHGVLPVADDEDALEHLADPDFDPRATVLLAGDVPSQPAEAAGSEERITSLGYDAEQITFQTETTRPAILVVADTFYPGWQATIDGNSVPILRANLMFRGVVLPAGRHRVVMRYLPTHWRVGVALSLGTLTLLLAGLSVTWLVK